MKTNSPIPIRITPHHLTLTPALSERVSKKIGPLVRIGGDATGADVVLRFHRGTALGKTFSASARLSMPGGDLHASATDRNLYKAISELEVRLARRLRKRKTRMEKNNEPHRSFAGVTPPPAWKRHFWQLNPSKAASKPLQCPLERTVSETVEDISTVSNLKTVI